MNKSTGVIYCIENTHNGKVYIGCTTQNFGSRIAQHLRNSETVKSPFYQDMKDHLTSFRFRVIEEDISLSQLRERETYWIRHFKSEINGYNQVAASGNEKLCESEIWEIRASIMGTNTKFSNIASTFGVSTAMVADINLGRAWKEDSLSYPLRKNTIKRKKLSESDVYAIYQLLKNPSISFKEIAKINGWKSEAVLRKINNGTYSISPLPKEQYPIRAVDSRKGKRKDNGMF